MTEPHIIVAERVFTSGPGEDGEAYAFFQADNGEVTVSVGWERFTELGEPDQLTVSLVAGKHVAAGSYSSVD